MEKNVVVIDEQGNKIGATFPKRAKGLVKNGRARFIDENTICLACPPNKNLEDNIMNNNINEILEDNTLNEEINASVEETDESSAETLTSREIFEQLKKLQDVKLHSPVNSFDKLAGTVQCLFEEKSESEDLSNIVEMLTDSFNNREETTWKLINLYEKMYEDVAELEKLKKTKDLIQGTYVGMLAITNNSIQLAEDKKLTQNQLILEKMTSMIEKVIS